jgi:hypothetical protein
MNHKLSLLPFELFMLRPHLQDVDIPLRIELTLDWIYRAHACSPNGGISKGYDLLRRRWAPAYPETTGYTIPTLLNTAAISSKYKSAELSYKLADFLLGKIGPEGGVAHWKGGVQANPIVFDTGQVIFGWLAVYANSQDERYLGAALRAGH